MMLRTLIMLFLYDFSAGQSSVANDPKCTLESPIITTPGCASPGWQFDQKSRECVSTCNSAAPFKDKTLCDATCRSREVCTAPRAATGCVAGSEVNVFYYEPHSKNCLPDLSCGYTGNNFPTAAECIKTCGGQIGQPDYCRHPPNQGYTCDRAMGSYRYFYDVSARQCLWFPYFGCGGGLNNFLTYEQCRKHCMQG
uniref:Putative kunitz-bpti protein n=1 Tax=Amblyomma americanum TaxID=6943 RepID=A0A0C9RXS7_AMBAM